VCGSRFVQIG